MSPCAFFLALDDFETCMEALPKDIIKRVNVSLVCWAIAERRSVVKSVRGFVVSNFTVVTQESQCVLAVCAVKFKGICTTVDQQYGLSIGHFADYLDKLGQSLEVPVSLSEPQPLVCVKTSSDTEWYYTAEPAS